MKLQLLILTFALMNAASAPLPWQMNAMPSSEDTDILQDRTNTFVVAVGRNDAPTMVILAVSAPEPLLAAPQFLMWGGQARLFPPYITETGIERSFESRGMWDSFTCTWTFRCLVLIQDPIRLEQPCIVRVRAQGVSGQVYEGFAAFQNP